MPLCLLFSQQEGRERQTEETLPSPSSRDMISALPEHLTFPPKLVTCFAWLLAQHIQGPPGQNGL